MLETVLISSDLESRKELIVLPNTVVLDQGSHSVEVINGFQLGSHLSFGNSGFWFLSDCCGGKYKFNDNFLLTFVQVKIFKFALEILEKRLGRVSNRCSR